MQMRPIPFILAFLTATDSLFLGMGLIVVASVCIAAGKCFREASRIDDAYWAELSKQRSPIQVTYEVGEAVAPPVAYDGRRPLRSHELQ